MATQTKTRTGADADARMDDAAERIRDLNERIIESGKQSGRAFADLNEKSLKSIADFQDKVGRASRVEWVSAIAHSQAQFTREIADAYTAAARGFLK